MTAGGSAQEVAEQSRRHARVLAEAAAEESRKAQRFAAGGAAEERTARLLAVLSSYDFHLLHDRKWPGTTAANIDHIVVGPSGVFVVDTKCWAGDVRVEGSSLYRGDSPCDDDLDKLTSQADAIRELLADVGLPATQVRPVLALDGRSLPLTVVSGVWVIGVDVLPKAILGHSKALTQTQVEQLVSALMVGAPPAKSSALPAPRPVPGPAAATEPEASLFSVEELQEEALAAAMKRPFADWMVFLHPAQARLVRRELNGPARITGGAGTGKTVVALHRLAYLSQRRPGRLLYTTFVRTIPLVLSSAFARLSPETVDRVEFRSLHSWARAFLRERHIPVSVDPPGSESAFARAWTRLPDRSLLERSAPFGYWREEVHTVIRGRDLRHLDDYLMLDRVGRGSRLGHVQRRAVWQLAETYAANLRAARVHDWNDLLRLARDEARRQPPDPAYDAIVLDEAQDMPLLAGQLLVAAAGDRPETLLFVGDDGQRVFPGGFRLSECGVDVTGRSVRFTQNYRNTADVYQVAAGLLSGQVTAVLDDGGTDDLTSTLRSGGPPVLVTAATHQEHDAALATSLAEWLASRHPSRTAAVLVERLAQQRDVMSRLRHESIPVVALDAWNGTDPEAVVVGTIKRAKGLEFSRVHVAYVEPRVMAAEPRHATDSAIEQWQLRRREMYVAMTRARDELWVGVLDPTAPSARPVEPETQQRDGGPTSGGSTGSVYALMHGVLGAEPTGGPRRFGEPGWTYEGVVVALTCASCGAAMHVCRKPYRSAGREFRYWALICPQCLTCLEPGDLSDVQRKVIRSLG